MQPASHSLCRLVRALCVVAFIAAALLGTTGTAHAGRVFIDPGHGGSFPGAVYNGITEASLNLAVAKELEIILQQRGHATALSRHSDVNVSSVDIPTWSGSVPSMRYATNGSYNVYDDLQARCDLANRWGADIFVSIHANAATATSANGAETYWRNESATDRILSARLATYVQQEYIKETGLTDRGVKVNAYYVLRWSDMPAILVETGFMSNSTELAKLKNPVFQRKAALGIARGIDLFFASNPFTAVYPRVSGVDRYATAATIADRGWPLDAHTVILTSGRSWPDALTGTPLSRPMNAPVLLAKLNLLPEATRARIAAQAPTRIVVLGGESAISSATVQAAVNATGRDPSTVKIDRIFGNNRYETAAAIARRVKVPVDGRVFVVSGATYPDALSIAPFAGASRVPILLVEPDRIPPSTLAFITDNAAAILQFEIVGGSSAVGPGVAAALSSYGRVVRVAGNNRYETNIRVIERFTGSGSVDPLIATGEDFPDALTAGALAATQRRPVMLVGGRYISPYMREFLVNNAARTADPTIIGGPAAVTYQADWMIRKSIAR